MLTKCPECELQVSDKALSCPHCGYPFKEKAKYKKSTKRKRLPNGFGQISEIKNQNLRNPFRAMVTVGFNSKGKPVSKLLKPQSYFKTYNEAYEALLEYNRNPYDLDDSITVKDLYERWFSEYRKNLKSDSSERTIYTAWNYCSSVYDMRVKDLRGRHIKWCMENGTANIKGIEKHPSAYVKSRIKSLFNLMLDYAVEYELTDRNYARTFCISDDVIKEISETKRAHIVFTDEEMQKLWSALGKISYVDIVLIQCYSGWRPQELGLIEISNVHLDKGYIVGGMKTEAGTDRIVPINEKIKELVKNRYDEAVAMNSKYLFNCTDARTHMGSTLLTYDKYKLRFDKIVDRLQLNPEHRPHDCRKQFITMAKKYNVDEYAIKYIVGHSITDITEKVYTEREAEWLIEEMGKIK